MNVVNFIYLKRVWRFPTTILFLNISQPQHFSRPTGKIGVDSFSTKIPSLWDYWVTSFLPRFPFPGDFIGD
jgi:hypothetical protein